jgi:hypothetical protein
MLSFGKSDLEKDCDKLLKGIEHIAGVLRRYYPTHQNYVENYLDQNIIGEAVVAAKNRQIWDRMYKGDDILRYNMLSCSFSDYLHYVRTGQIRRVR